MVAARLANLSDGQRSSANLQEVSRAKAADMLNVSERGVNIAVRVLKQSRTTLLSTKNRNGILGT